MTTQAAPQLTPSQLVDAGRRAEAQGRPDLAVRFYCHLIEHFAEAAEAVEAHDALGRIDFRQTDAAQPHAAVSPALRHRRRPERGRYAAGRVLARALGVAGWVLALTGPTGFPAYLLLHADAGALSRAELLPMAGSAAGSLIVGFGVVLAAEVARAQFDQADAARDLVALERARSGSST